MTAWYDDDAFWRRTHAFLFGDERWQAAEEEADQVAALLELAPGACVLDLACGPGRHSLALARRGFRVTGVDRTARYLDIARQKAVAESLSVEWQQVDMRAFRRPQAFDAALSLFTSFGYFEDPADDLRVAENLFASLRPGGRLVVDMMGKEVLARIFQPRDWHRLPDGSYILEQRSVRDDWSWIDVQWVFFDQDGEHTYRIGHRLYSASELERLLAEVGFVNLRAHGSLAGVAYDHVARRLVVVGERPA